MICVVKISKVAPTVSLHSDFSSELTFEIFNGVDTLRRGVLWVSLKVSSDLCTYFLDFFSRN